VLKKYYFFHFSIFVNYSVQSFLIIVLSWSSANPSTDHSYRLFSILKRNKSTNIRSLLRSIVEVIVSIIIIRIIFKRKGREICSSNMPKAEYPYCRPEKELKC